MPEFYIMFARKKYFPGFFFGGGVVGEGNPLAPISYTYGWAPGPHQLNPALIASLDTELYSPKNNEKVMYQKLKYFLINWYVPKNKW